MERDRSLIPRRRCAADARAAAPVRDIEELLVEKASDPLAAVVGVHAYETDVTLVAFALREETHQQTDEAAVVFGEEDRVPEVAELDAGDKVAKRPSVPPSRRRFDSRTVVIPARITDKETAHAWEHRPPVRTRRGSSDGQVRV